MTRKKPSPPVAAPPPEKTFRAQMDELRAEFFGPWPEAEADGTPTAMAKARTVPRDQWPTIVEKRRAEVTRMQEKRSYDSYRFLPFVDDAELTGDWMGYGSFEAYARDGLGIDPRAAAAMHWSAVKRVYSEPFEKHLKEMLRLVCRAPGEWGDHYIWRMGVMFGLVDEDDEEACVPVPEPLIPWEDLEEWAAARAKARTSAETEAAV